MPRVDLEAVELVELLDEAAKVGHLWDEDNLEIALALARTYVPALVARVRELEGIVTDLLRDNTELARELQSMRAAVALDN